MSDRNCTQTNTIQKENSWTYPITLKYFSLRVLVWFCACYKHVVRQKKKHMFNLATSKVFILLWIVNVKDALFTFVCAWWITQINLIKSIGTFQQRRSFLVVYWKSRYTLEWVSTPVSAVYTITIERLIRSLWNFLYSIISLISGSSWRSTELTQDWRLSSSNIVLLYRISCKYWSMNIFVNPSFCHS